MAAWQHKVVLVTGGSSGIGLALVEQLLAEGAYVVACSRNPRMPESISHPEKLLLVTADVSRKEDCDRFVAEALARFGKIDVLINNAGISMRALVEEVDTGVLEEVMQINFWGTVYCTKAALPHIKKERGVIAGISSIAGYRGLPGRAAYSASKAALQSFLEVLRTELLHSGTAVLWISPGFTASNIRKVARAADGSAQGETPLAEDKLMSASECAAHILKAIAMRRRETILTTQGKVTVWLNKLFPALADRMVYNHFRKEPDSPLR